ncbi:hypothetical protein K438DRAFT_652304 [Mycena galopus ATCC 62051]|nr:hypothetical protein K438DRAFT_652304 [Mycena galopus ATCC 62051]
MLLGSPAFLALGIFRATTFNVVVSTLDNAVPSTLYGMMFEDTSVSIYHVQESMSSPAPLTPAPSAIASPPHPQPPYSALSPRRSETPVRLEHRRFHPERGIRAGCPLDNAYIDPTEYQQPLCAITERRHGNGETIEFAMPLTFNNRPKAM